MMAGTFVATGPTGGCALAPGPLMLSLALPRGGTEVRGYYGVTLRDSRESSYSTVDFEIVLSAILFYGAPTLERLVLAGRLGWDYLFFYIFTHMAILAAHWWNIPLFGCSTPYQNRSACDFLLKYYDVRQKSRAEEMDAIGEAKAILSGSDFGQE